MPTCPAHIGHYRVVAWVTIDAAAETAGAAEQYAGGMTGPATRLAICRLGEANGVYLLYCTANWDRVRDTWCKNYDAAVAHAEREYPKVAGRWAAFN
ncbi:MAG: hypothetical protein GC159_21870 [Phycisphaera sp.]|nr:hypothetical protein [Phycisphaera sp.]